MKVGVGACDSYTRPQHVEPKAGIAATFPKPEMRALKLALTLLADHLQRMLLGSSVIKVDNKFSVYYIYRKIDVNYSAFRSVFMDRNFCPDQGMKYAYIFPNIS